ncbi:helix-turn-helix transcriptional regulator [Puniceicoccaceae bacterium K14]|nr:helix-turn-helix transcriptional regulator [Puniceicoccaceae bacterium K14]
MSTPQDLFNLPEIAAEAGYNVNKVAESFDITVRQLQRDFKKNLGRTPQDWLNEQRMIAAYQLLQESRSVKEVAFELGFKQVSHFCRKIKTTYGMTPSEIRVSSFPSSPQITNRSRMAENLQLNFL